MKLRKKIVLMLSAILLMTLMAAGFYARTAYRFSTSELAKTFKDYRGSGQVSQAIQKSEPFTILLMGVDTGSESRQEQWEGNSDSMMLVTVNPKTEKATITSLERDILVELSGPKDNKGTGAQAKLNASYASGGAQMAIMTVEDLLDIKIDYYMQLNMKGLVDLVDAMGGITVTNDFDFPIKIYDWEPEYTATVEPGTHKINGEQALVYSRMRYDDPDGDYGRQRRQREVIGKILDKLLAMDSISSYRKILRAVSKNMQTDIEISTATIPSLLGYRSLLSKMKNYQLHGEDADLPDGSYQAVTAEHLLETQNRIKKELGLKTSKKLKTSAIVYEELFGLATDIELVGREQVPVAAETVESSSQVPVQEPVETTTPVVQEQVVETVPEATVPATAVTTPVTPIEEVYVPAQPSVEQNYYYQPSVTYDTPVTTTVPEATQTYTEQQIGQ